MNAYVGTKIVKAEKMDQNTFLYEYRNGDGSSEEISEEGYHVAYPNPDGSLYHSWTPKEVFELAYRRITESELTLIS